MNRETLNVPKPAADVLNLTHTGSVTRFGEISLHSQFYEVLFIIWEILVPTLVICFTYTIGKKFVVMNGQIMKTIKANWSHCQWSSVIYTLYLYFLVNGLYYNSKDVNYDHRVFIRLNTD